MRCIVHETKRRPRRLKPKNEEKGTSKSKEVIKLSKDLQAEEWSLYFKTLGDHLRVLSR
jgi:hypothetical protein